MKLWKIGGRLQTLTGCPSTETTLNLPKPRIARVFKNPSAANTPATPHLIGAGVAGTATARKASGSAVTRIVQSVYARRMPASPIVRAYYEELIKRFAEPDGSLTFTDAPGASPTWPARIDVLHWADTEDLDINTFATVGMCDRPMQGADHRCELHFSIRSRADDLEIGKIGAFCANLALYPFEHGTFFDWTQVVISPGTIPHFPNCCCVMLHPAFHKDGWDESVYDAVKVEIMNIVPLTPNEMAHRKKHGPFSMYDYFIEHAVDLFSDAHR